ncbi:MAG: hypothetical protein VX641_07655 [Planctomycetota bacterium]|nr:hypothetical protein [Planctomycetota bacterium]
MTSNDPINDIINGFVSQPELTECSGSTLSPARAKMTIDRDRRSHPRASTSTDDDSTQASKIPPLGLELLFLGNLPHWAKLWAPEYARRVAAEDGPVALVQLGYKTCTVQVFGGCAGTTDLPEGSSDRIQDIVNWLALHVNRVLIEPRALDDDETILETELPVTIMTGADEAAKIEAYRRSKELVEVARAAELPAPRMGIVVAGTRESEARMIAARIGETAERFLKFALPLIQVIPSMGPDSTGSSAGDWHDVEVGQTYGTERFVAELRRASLDRTCGSSEEPGDLPEAEAIELAAGTADDLLDSRGDVTESAPGLDPLSGVLESLAEVPVAGPDARELEALQDERRALEERFEPVAASEAARPTEPQPVPAEATTRVLEDEGGLGPDVERSEEAFDSRGCLANLIPGLTVIDLPCPVDQRIELALDEDHHLHLVAHESSFRSLRAAEAWAITNRSLLEAVLPGLAPFEQRGVRLDLLVEDAAEASDLQKTGLFLHLLEEVDGRPRTLALNNRRSALNLG